MEYDKTVTDNEWEAIFAREAYRLDVLLELQKALVNELPEDDNSSLYWKKKLELFDLDTQIKATEHYINSAKTDKAQQDAYREAVMKAIDEKSTDIMAKARRSIASNTDRKPVLEALLKNMPERGTPKWYKTLQEINEHTNVAKMPTTAMTDIQVVKEMPKLHAR